MATIRSQSQSLESLVDEFTASLTSLLEETSLARAREAVLSAFGGKLPSGAGRRGKLAGLPALAVNGTAPERKKRKKAPIQLCPVPGCKNRAAPIFGMVCSKHKDLPKTKIRKFREARRQKKLKAA
jgi:hypothetical protein